MPRTYSLPKAHNPLLLPENTPSISELVAKRRLGQTNLAVKAEQVGTSNATKLVNLGMFDYAHLRAPLPKDLKGSEIFQDNGHRPESYFLMRRSNDGYISATGMFKAAFPWATLQEEEDERQYVRKLPTTSSDETAGNIWIAPTHALELGQEYKISGWIQALLDPSPITISASQKSITSPPKFVFPESIPHLAPQTTTATPSRSRRSKSPSKLASPTKKIASPRKKATKAATAASATLQASLKDAISTTSSTAPSAADSTAPSTVDPTPAKGVSKPTIEIESKVETNGETEITTTNVRLEMPPGSPELPFAEKPEEVIAKAKEMVKEAIEKDSKSTSAKKSKRKADELEEDEVVEGQPGKKAKVLEQQLRTEKIKTRALIGLTATVAIGALIPYVL